MSEAEATTVAEKKTRHRYNISPETFALAWSQSANVDEVVKRLSDISGQPVPRENILSRAAFYRRNDVPLKKMPRRGKVLDVAGLQTIVSSAAAPAA